MKKKILAIALSLVVCFLLVAPAALAYTAKPITGTGTQLDTVAPKAGLKTADLVTTIGNIINYLLAFLGLAMLIIFIYAGFLYMTAGGVEDKTKKAKAWMKNAVIGMVIILLSYAISNFVINTLTEVTT